MCHTACLLQVLLSTSCGCDTHIISALLPLLPPLSSYVLELVTPTYQILDHDFNLFLGHIHIFCRSFQSDFILSFSEFDVNLETQAMNPVRISKIQARTMLLVRPTLSIPATRRWLPSH